MCLKCLEYNGKKYGYNLRFVDKRKVYCFIVVGRFKI